MGRGVAELLPLFGKSKTSTPGKGVSPPPPAPPPLPSGVGMGLATFRETIGADPNFFSAKGSAHFLGTMYFHTALENIFAQFEIFTCQRKKPERSWKFLPYFGVENQKKTRFLTTF